MLVTKLKNSRKFAAAVIIVFLFVLAAVMVNSYSAVVAGMENQSAGSTDEAVREDIVQYLSDGNYILYGMAFEDLDEGSFMEEGNSEDFFLLRKYMDYEMFDANGGAVLGNSDETVQEALTEPETEYALRATFVYGDGGLKSVTVDGTAVDVQEQYSLEQWLYDEEYEWLDYYITEDVRIIYGITETNLSDYIDVSEDDSGFYLQSLLNSGVYQLFEYGLMLAAAAAALLIPFCRGWRIPELKIFQVSLEYVLFVWVCLLSLDLEIAEFVYCSIQHATAETLSQMGMSGGSGYTAELLLNILMWFAVFAVVYWGVTCIRPVFSMKLDYFRERSVCGRLWCRFRNNTSGHEKKKLRNPAGFLKKAWHSVKEGAVRLYDGLQHLDFRDKTNKVILKIVLLNFIILFIICNFWYRSIYALIFYSVLLFLFFRKYLKDIQKKYSLLLEATNRLAEGDLETEITEDMGVFNPVKTEIQKIQKGFQKAVQEEVKSERMKTELVSNVSHDLKTPLTAIITYVDLLKQEKNPEKQKEYLQILERKSLRLKALIEDLFEISKASSKNVTMNYMNVDIAGLLKQVTFENEEKIRAAHLELKWKLPEGKVILALDSQKAYRIFENLIVNITKYALPHTRVYLELTVQEDEVTVTMKNVSASELDFNTDEITDRFVRGDASRNTEGSGLGLAIAKSFTELHQGTLKISTDGDLFKAEIRLPKRMV